MASKGGGGIFRTILLWMGIIIVLLLIALFFATGGARKIAVAASGIKNPLSYIFGGNASGTAFRLPWQPDLMPHIQDIPEGDGTDDASQSDSEQLRSTQNEYDALNARVVEAQNFGAPSPYRGQVTISGDAASATDTSEQYITVEAAVENSAPVSLAGWSLQSAVTGARAYVPRGAKLFLQGAVNAQEDIYLNPGSSAIISSGFSPVGVSFRENMCTGFLGQFQNFTPSLSASECPAASAFMPLTADNIRVLGQSCFDFLNDLPSCTFPTNTADIAPSCRTFVTNNVSYNGCVALFRYKSAFYHAKWRIYLGSSLPLWLPGHDVVRLLDERGRTVDALTY